MTARSVLVPISVLCGIGAVLVLVPPLSASVPAIFSVPLVAFWLFAWYLDARLTSKNWQLVLEGREANVLVLALARISACKPSVAFAAHAAFSVGAAAGLQALVTHSLDHFVSSCILTVFGILHIDALFQNRMFVKEVARQGKCDAAGKDEW